MNLYLSQRRYIVLRYSFLFLLLISNPAFAMLTFDAQNFAQSIKNYGQQIKQMQELKQQTEHHVLQSRQLLEQSKMQKNNLKKLNFNNIKDMYNNLNNIQSTLSQSKNNLSRLQEIDNRNRDLFNQANAKPLPSAEENRLLNQHLRQNMETNKRAMNALKVLDSYEQDKKRTNDLVLQSQNSSGQMQAMQSSNQLAAIQIKELQELKLLMAESLESRVAAVAEENTATVLAEQKFRTQMAKKPRTGKIVTLPKLK